MAPATRAATVRGGWTGCDPAFLVDLSPLLHPWTTAMLAPFGDDDGTDSCSIDDGLHGGDDNDGDGSGWTNSRAATCFPARTMDSGRRWR
ncbi:uncharacterized protein DS421_7g206660 [Arachis hypogaea]|nr:uncharacterized protein DS421_7g206660 [Arachis hypogaea]